jgi:hypothetical protein
MSRRVRKSTKKDEEPHATEEKSEAQPNNVSSNTFAQTMELINKIKGITEIVKPTDLENISNKLNKLEELSMVSKEINEIKSELNSLATYAKIFFGIGAAALLIFCINEVVTLLNYLRPK